jgi:type 1 fimbriae regulatory protein FimB/type 1 fimbriae regulatory protein FimE
MVTADGPSGRVEQGLSDLIASLVAAVVPEAREAPRRAASHVGRYGHRDATLILLAYRHGLRVSELVAMRWDQIDLEQGLLHVSRVKN